LSIIYKSVQIFAMLINENANPNISDYTFTTPLHYSSKNGMRSVVELLIGKGAYIEAKDHNGSRAVHFAAENNDLYLLIYLKSNGAQLNIVDNWNRTPHNMSTDKEVKWLIEERFTCRTHPLQIDYVQNELLGKCKIGMSMCPGRNKKNWRRDLDVDINVLLSQGIQTVLSLVRQDELDSMGIPKFRQELEKKGIESLHFPIVDKWIPSAMDDLVRNVEQLIVRIKQGRIILVHCNGGKGRTGLLVVSTLVALGMEVNDAVQAIREARPGMIQNPAQLIYVRAFKKVWFQTHT